MGKVKFDSKKLAKFLATLAIEKIAQNVVILDLTQIETAPANFFVLCSCDSDAQMRSIVDEVLNKTKDFGISKPRIEGLDSKQWILVDYFDVVLHLMQYETRKFYNIERLWADGSFYKLSETSYQLVKIRNKSKFLSEIYFKPY